jgi:hypothetical protein
MNRIIIKIAAVAVLAIPMILYANEKPVIAPDFKLKNHDGKEVKLADYKGKIVVLCQWARQNQPAMCGLKPASNLLPYISSFLHSPKHFGVLYASNPEGSRSVSLGPAAEREWAPNKLVGASPPQAERDRPARY